LSIVVALCGASLGAAGQVGDGSSEGVRFVWTAPAECPSQDQVESEIARLVGGDLRLRQASALRAEVTVSGGPIWSADLTTEQAGQKGYRNIAAPSCQAAADAIALIIALSIDPDAVAASDQGTGASAPPPVVLQAPRHEERHDERPLRIVASVHGQGRLGASPAADLGVGVGIGLAGARWRTDLRWTYGLRHDQVASLSSGAAGRFNLATGSLTGCMDAGLVAVALGPCAVVEAGRASVTGYGATAGFSRDVPWVALGGGAFSSLPLSKHLRASMELDVLLPLYRPDYVFADMPGVVFKAPAVGARALFDVSWEF